MTPGARTDCTYSIVFAGSVRCPDLGRDVVAAHLGLTTQEAARRLAAAPSVLAKALAPEAARRLVTLLRLLGLPAGCEPEPTLAQASCALTFDLAIQPTANAPAADIAGYLAKRLNRPEASFLSLLQAPGGLVVQNLTWPSASAWRSDKGLSRALILMSETAGAPYDILPWYRPQNSASAAGLARHLSVLGLSPCPLTGAVAAGIEHAMAAHLLRRYGNAGLLAVNRDFQRFDLIMTGSPGLSARELADFLTTRTGQPRKPGMSAPSEAIDCALTRADALAFQADYALIGIETRLRLVAGARGGS